MNDTFAPATEAPTKDYRAPLRFWHWGNSALISFQLATILFLKVIVSPRSAVPEFLHDLDQQHVALTAKQANVFAHIIGDRIWEWHIYAGWGLVAFWVLRLFLQLTGPSELRFTARLMEVLRRYRLAPLADKSKAGKILFAKTTYALFYAFITIMVITGLILIYEDVSWLSSIQDLAKETHEFTMYLIIGFLVLHVAGVVWAEISEDHGLISRRVGGEGPTTEA